MQKKEPLSPAAVQSSAVAAPALPRAFEPGQEPSIVLAAGGDVNFGRECGQAILKDPTYDPFAGLGPAWSDADARFVNLESQLSDQHGVTQSPEHRLIFTGPPGGAEVLAQAHISLVSTANNHAWDYGKSALFETLANLERAQVLHAGTGRDRAQAYQPAIVHVKGRSLALFAVTQVWNQPPFDAHEGRDFVAWADLAELGPRIERARRENDFVLVSYHGGEEYISAPIDRTRAFVNAVMALGVDAVIGHHPHVLQGVGWVEDRPVLYSLGNFVFAGHDDRPWTKLSYFARLTLKKGEPTQLEACPFAIDGHRPRSLSRPVDALDVERFRLHLIGTSTSTGGSRVAPPDALGCLRVTALRGAQPSERSSSN
ncbi:MAG TPA: CapA family protein [Polyangiaceae bacterium]|nr:CapA family protein [Polyangiaceae bacterium]